MPDEPEVIVQQMRETRSALTEKLETLEHQVVDTVAGANEAVVETVENVKDAVHETVEAVKESVKSTFDFPGQMDRYPWLFMGGAVAVGFITGRLLERAADHPGVSGHASREPLSSTGLPPAGPNGLGSRFRPDQEERPAYSETRRPEEPGWLSNLASKFAPELRQLKSLALGTALSVARDMVVQAAPDPLRQQLHEVMNDITTKVGGQPIEGPVFEPASEGLQTSREFQPLRG